MRFDDDFGKLVLEYSGPPETWEEALRRWVKNVLVPTAETRDEIIEEERLGAAYLRWEGASY